MSESASVCGRRAGKVERRPEGSVLAERSRSATRAAEPQTEARRSCGQCEIAARDERACSVAERARSRGGQGGTGNP